MPDYLDICPICKNKKPKRNVTCSKECGRLSATIKTSVPFEERFWSKVKKAGSDECWEWQGGITSDGYGNLRIYHPETGENSMQLSHRIAYFIQHKEWPGDFYVCHTCDNRKCVNPSHLWLGTHLDNIKDRTQKGRSNRPFGETNGKTKLTNAQAQSIISRYSNGERSVLLAIEFGITQKTVLGIAKGRSWSHIRP